MGHHSAEKGNPPQSAALRLSEAPSAWCEQKLQKEGCVNRVISQGKGSIVEVLHRTRFFPSGIYFGVQIAACSISI